MTWPLLHIFYGSQTGNAEHIAKRIHKECGDRGLASQLTVLNDWKKLSGPAFEEVEVAIFVISTTGNGDAPENSEKFWRFVKRRTNAKTLLSKMSYTVLGLGDTNYDKFCYMGKSLDTRLSELGASRFHRLGCADEATGLEETVEPWVTSMWPALTKLVGGAVEGGGSSTASAAVTTASNAQVSEGGAAASAAGGGGSAASPPAEVVVSPPAPESSSTAGQDGGLGATTGGAAVQEKLVQQVVGGARGAGPACRWSGARWMEDVVPGYEAWRQAATQQQDMGSNGSKEDLPDLELDITNEDEASPVKPMLGGGASKAENTKEMSSSSVPSGAPALPVDGDAGCVRATIAGARYLAKTKDRRVIELQLAFPPESSLSYVPGDAIGVSCPNPPSLVKSLLACLTSTTGAEGVTSSLKPNSRVTIKRGTALGGQVPPSLTLEELFTWRADLTQLPKPRLLRSLAAHCSSDEDRKLLLHLSSPDSTKVYESFVTVQRLSVPELLEFFPTCRPPLALLLDLLPPLAPRYYSVASSPLVHPDSVTVAFTVVDYRIEVPLGSSLPEGGSFTVHRRGVCTSWLEDLAQAHIMHKQQQQQSHRDTSTVNVLLKPSKEFAMPGSPKWPLVMIGPGTGVAPFMGFLQHRLAKRKQHRQIKQEVCTGYWRGGFEVCEEGEEEEGSVEAYSNKEGQGPTWLFFGCRDRDTDWLFRSEMEEYQREGVLTELSTAFSRELPGKKVYVQDRMVQHGARLCKWLLSEGAYVYVCGDADNMARDVHAALRTVLVQHGGVTRFPTAKEADDFLTQLKQRQRYVLDIWT